MFDQLVESVANRAGRRPGRYVLMTGLAYSLVLLVGAIVAITGFHPVLAEEFGLRSLIAPPPPSSRPTAAPASRLNPAGGKMLVADRLAPAWKSEVPILPPGEADKIQLSYSGHNGPSRIGDWPGAGGSAFVPGSGGDGPPLPPPAPKPAPTPEPVRKIEPTRQVSEGALLGIAINRVKPEYPLIAKQVKADGPVQIRITISEEGRVIEAEVLSGHPTLRQAALNAARQWIFTPTTLSRTPVKIQGILTFNFVLPR